MDHIIQRSASTTASMSVWKSAVYFINHVLSFLNFQIQSFSGERTDVLTQGWRTATCYYRGDTVSAKTHGSLAHECMTHGITGKGYYSVEALNCNEELSCHNCREVKSACMQSSLSVTPPSKHSHRIVYISIYTPADTYL